MVNQRGAKAKGTVKRRSSSSSGKSRRSKKKKVVRNWTVPMWLYYVLMGCGSAFILICFYYFFIRPYSYRWKPCYGTRAYGVCLPSSFQVHGFDISHHQGDIDWEQVKAAGYEFAILRIGYRGYGEEGTLNADEKFEQNMENARKAGIDVGVYFFSQAVNEEEAKEEADFVLEHLKGQELQMPVVYDPEHILEDEARTDGVTGEQFTQNAKVFCKEIEEAGYDAMIYSNMLWEAYELDLEKLLDYPVWYADYEELPQTPYKFTMWQYSSTGSVAGIEGNVDLNIQLLKK